jgi:hypothetical protein
MSDRDLRRILEEVITEIDQGRLRPIVPMRMRGRIGGAILAAALGLGVTACEGRVVGAVTDAGGPPDVVRLEQPDAAVFPDAEVFPDAAPDSGPIPAYGIPDVDAGTVVSLDGGIVAMYLAMSFDAAGIDAVDAGDAPEEDAEVNIPAYMAPFPETDADQD